MTSAVRASTPSSASRPSAATVAQAVRALRHPRCVRIILSLNLSWVLRSVRHGLLGRPVSAVVSRISWNTVYREQLLDKETAGDFFFSFLR